ncbi:MAG: hypothetical protein O2798_01465 [Chloroflexi bacterium]|nr:hypothetical protein [Chloroflexota bacterium]MDA1239488.1 hypothetical protein [Chloroflexota bacterium]
MEVTMVLTELGKKWHDEIRKVVKEAVAEAGLEIEVQESVIRADEESIDARCIGSPTIRVDGFDVEYMEREPEERSAGVRYFNTMAGWKPVPEKGMIVRALQRAKEREAGK